jgi:hypothetical protein
MSSTGRKKSSVLGSHDSRYREEGKEEQGRIKKQAYNYVRWLDCPF